MNRYDLIFNKLKERVEKGELTAEQAQVINEKAYEKYKDSSDIYLESDDLMTESLVSPVTKLKKKIEEIKNKKPSENDKSDEITEFIENNEKDLEKAAELCEKEPEEIKKNDIKFLVSIVLSVIAAIGGVGLAVGTGATVGLVIGTVGYLWIYLGSLISIILRYCRINTDRSVIDNLTKIKKALVKSKQNVKDEKTKKKIDKLIEKIDDAETSMNAKFKVSESANITLEEALVYCESILMEAEDDYQAAVNGNDSVNVSQKKFKGFDYEMGEKNPVPERGLKNGSIYDGGEEDNNKSVLNMDKAIENAEKKFKGEDYEMGDDNPTPDDFKISGLQNDGGEVRRTSAVLNADMAIDKAEKRFKGGDYETGDENPVKEYTHEDIIEKKLAIYEAYDNGAISESDKDQMITLLDSFI